MSQSFVGEIRMFGGSFAPQGWAFCDGRLLSVSENDTLFSLIGTTYGGDGQTTFALPDLRGRAPIHMGQGAGLSSHAIGSNGGVEKVTVTVNQLPSHDHSFSASSATAGATSPSGNVVASPASIDLFRPGSTLDQTMASNAVAPTGNTQSHDNVQPFQCVSFIISLYGIYPSRS